MHSLMFKRLIWGLFIAFVFSVSCGLLAESSRAKGIGESEFEPNFVIDDTVYLGSPVSVDAHDNSSFIDEYLGVPFAAPPVGDLRWQATKPYVASGATLDVKQFAPGCMQADRIVEWYQGVIADFGGDPSQFATPTFSEDCLYLNVWAPKAANNLPVYVYMHGGSNKAGWSYEPNYIGRKMAERGVVVVSIAYRLGVFGFFPHGDSEYANFALLDQIAALTWVKNNISKVGGDPLRVTLAGESAGADNVSVLLGSPLAKGLFQRAVIESGAWSILSMPRRQDLAEQTRKLAAQTLNNENASLKELRTIDAEVLTAAAEDAFAEHGFGPSVGDPVMPISLGMVAEAGKLHNVDVIVGSNRNEYLVYLEADQTVQAWLDEHHIESPTANAIKALLNDGSGELEQVDRLITAAEFGCPSLKLAEQINRSGSRAWVYYFNKVRAGELASKMGAYHGAELPYVFNTHDEWLPTSAADLKLTEEIANFWLAFSSQGEPQSEGVPKWEEFDKGQRHAMSLSENLRLVQHPSIQLCQLLGIIE